MERKLVQPLRPLAQTIGTTATGPYWGAGYYPWAWFGAGAAAGWWGSPGYAYVNPYYVAADYSGDSYNYDQPIPAPPQTDTTANYAVDDSATAGGDTQQTVYSDSGDANTQQAMVIFNSGRELFKQNDYQGALDKVDQAIKMLPSDATLHEFRGACLFALKQYQKRPPPFTRSWPPAPVGIGTP